MHMLSKFPFHSNQGFLQNLLQIFPSSSKLRPLPLLLNERLSLDKFEGSVYLNCQVGSLNIRLITVQSNKVTKTDEQKEHCPTFLSVAVIKHGPKAAWKGFIPTYISVP